MGDNMQDQIRSQLDRDTITITGLVHGRIQSVTLTREQALKVLPLPAASEPTDGGEMVVINGKVVVR